MIVYVNPVNDLVNLSMSVDYHFPKPHASVREDKLVFSKPYPYDPGVSFHFGPEYDSLNKLFEQQPRNDPTVLSRLARVSTFFRLLAEVTSGRLRLVGTPAETIRVLRDQQSCEEWTQIYHEKYRSRPMLRAVRFWPEIAEFESERQTLETTLDAVLKVIRDHVEHNRSNLLVVISQERYRSQPLWIDLTTIVKQKLPQFEFEWGWSKRAVQRATERLGIETLVVEYEQEGIESKYIQCDGHTSGEGFAFTVEQIVRSGLPIPSR